MKFINVLYLFKVLKQLYNLVSVINIKIHGNFAHIRFIKVQHYICILVLELKMKQVDLLFFSESY